MLSSEKSCQVFGKFTRGLFSEEESLAKGIEKSLSCLKLISKFTSL